MESRVAIIGSGNWGSAISKIVGSNTKDSDVFESTVKMWVYEEIIDGKKLTDIINEQHENTKYLPNHKLPDNIVAIPDCVEAAKGADILVFVLPHQFVYRICEELKPVVRRGCHAISLIKGVDFRGKELSLFSEEIERILGIPCAALSGANIAIEVADEQFSEATIACRRIQEEGPIFQALFHAPYFDVRVIGDISGLQVCGALKNVIALGAGFVDGLGLGDNTKAAVLRQGLLEMRLFGKTFFGGVHTETFFESCGVADLITTCSGGRNARVARTFIQTSDSKTMDELERELLNGQKLQGTTTAKEVYQFLQLQKKLDRFPLLVAIYRIVYEVAPPRSIINCLRTRQTFD
ncbi:glycerol-3-phosphate dehydrogenase [NAD+] [Hesseltinella vesiculosa]|uniref:Glycerol-3-phosphate dehydrogenase [NAD(+)] n=1 Tax=Hesseltinella vesiculosa TaxID=101127 RepID=A0A1X2GNM8_9FUNG|nr:glycerol-3-phosphate dehydrogenase [NAD+] [Hesseltinella vesiculosa]